MTSQPHRRLLIFARFPEPSKVKTRLIPALGAEAAAALHAEMTAHTFHWARELRRLNGVDLEIRFDGGSIIAMNGHFGCDLRYVRQCEGDLGSRLTEGFQQAFECGFSEVLAVGTDCPAITTALAIQAFNCLETHDVVVGPAEDGGYYLIGLKSFSPRVFERIEWGTERVLDQTLERVEETKLSAAQLVELADVDRPCDLPIWDAYRRPNENILFGFPETSGPTAAL